MVDGDGSTGAGTQACCELFGYRWDGSRCMNDRKLNLSGTPTAGIGATPPPGGVEEPPVPPPDLRVISGGGTRRSWGLGSGHRFGGGELSSEGFSGIFGLGGLGWARHEGEFFIGGGWERSIVTEATEIQARAQAGTLVLMGEGDISTIGNVVELNNQGRESGEFNPPEDSMTACRLTVAMFTDDAGIDEAAESSWDFWIKNDGGTVTTTTSPVAGSSSGSSMLANIDLSLTVSGSLVQIGLRVDTNGTTADTLYASGRLDYVWARFR